MSRPPKLPEASDFPEGTSFVVKDFDVPLVWIPREGWVNWFGGTPRPYAPDSLTPDNNWPAGSFEEWIRIVQESLECG
jgi:hypothetical protein